MFRLLAALVSISLIFALAACGAKSEETETGSSGAGESREEVEWFNCSAFGKLAENCNQYLTKGKQVYVEGRLSSRTYQTQNGETRHSNDINVTEVQFLGQRGDSGSQDQGPEPAGQAIPTIASSSSCRVSKPF